MNHQTISIICDIFPFYFKLLKKHVFVFLWSFFWKLIFEKAVIVFIRLPFKQDPSGLGDSCSQALNPFRLLVFRLLRKVQLHDSNVEFMHDYLAQEHISLNNSPNPNEGYFIQHQCVKKGDSDKIKVLFQVSW